MSASENLSQLIASQARLGESNFSLSISTAGDTAVPSGSFRRSVQVVAADGVEVYIRKLVLDISKALNGDVISITLEIAASANPTIEIRNATSGGTVLQSVSGDAASPTYCNITLTFSGSAWRVENVNYF